MATNNGQVISTREGLYWIVHPDENALNSLRKAKKQAEENDGFVATLPQLLKERVLNPYDGVPVDPYDAIPEEDRSLFPGAGIYLKLVGDNNKIWSNNLTALSEEDVGKTRQGNMVWVVTHGAGIILNSPYRIEQAYKPGQRGDLSELSYLSDKEMFDLLDGKLPDGSEIPVYSYDEFKRGIRALSFTSTSDGKNHAIEDLTMRYAVVLDFDMAKESFQGRIHGGSSYFHDDPLTIVRAGGVEEAVAYINLAQSYHPDFANHPSPMRAKNYERPRGQLLEALEFLEDDNINPAEIGFTNIFRSSGNFVAVHKPLDSLENKVRSTANVGPAQ